MEYPNRRERRKLKLNYEGKFFIFGAILGSIMAVFWDYYFNHTMTFNNFKEEVAIEQMRIDTNQMLLNYVDGRWISSVSDLIVVIDIDSQKNFVVIETMRGVKSEFKIVNIKKVNGALGIVKLEICNLKSDCKEQQNLVPIQLNKVFGIDRAITITYDSRLAYCSEEEDQCVRGFKRHED